ncbi:MAG: glycosyltransferase family 39 protein [Pseudomonadales bacterium]|nr:glycosyltransferase family 39 protein [Candidatus Woesebacteria bacterium]MCB9800813.1 glycosyltransferase family 39 protein [Pseudomonadales bacterium]
MAGVSVLKKLLSVSTLVVCITGVGMVARFWKMEFVPFQNDADELAFVYAGQSMLEQGIPISWSSFSYDEKYHYSYETTGDKSYNTEGEITFIKPWFDHPYLLSLLQGLWTEAWGYRFPSAPPSLLVRVPMLALALATLVLFWKIVRQLFSEQAAVFAYALFALSPAFIIGQRMVVGENVIVPFLLASIYIMISKSKQWYALLPVLAAGALLTKMTGVIVLLVIGLWFVLQKNWKSACVYTGLGAGLFLLLYLPFVYSLGWQEFIEITSKQSFRLLGWVNPAFIMSQPGFHHYIFFDLSYYLILILGFSGVIIGKQSLKTRFMQFSTLGALLLLWITSAEQDALGWYKLPLFTLLTVSTGYMFEVIKPSIVAIVGLIMVTNNQGLVRFVEHPLPTTERLRLTVTSLIGVPFILDAFTNKKIQQKAITFGLVVVLFLAMAQALYVADSFYDAQCQHKHCPIPLVTTTQLLKGFYE